MTGNRIYLKLRMIQMIAAQKAIPGGKAIITPFQNRPDSVTRSDWDDQGHSPVSAGSQGGAVRSVMVSSSSNGT